MGRQQCSQPPGPPQLWSITQGTLWVWEVWLSGASGLTGRNMPLWAAPLVGPVPPQHEAAPSAGKPYMPPRLCIPGTSLANG